MVVQIEHERDRINDRPQLRWSGTRKNRKIGGKKLGFQFSLSRRRRKKFG
jgi:hypothetical protein